LKMKDLPSLKTKRTVLKQRITKKEKFFLGINIETFDDAPKLQVNKVRFDEMTEEFMEIQNNIILLLKLEEVEAEGCRFV
jgi:hypothetical protein